ncbi:MAG TPA: ATP-binding protein [Magnetospirillaceae bacterium]|nr:ATP-binding protein [Magnetospirillaceae bacterium]
MSHLAARYGISLLLVGLALAVGLLFGPNFDVKLGPLLFLGAVMLSAWFAGPGPGLAAIILATLAVEYFWTEPIYSFIIVRQELPLMVSFILCGLVGLALSLQRRRQARVSEENRTSLERRVAERTAQLRTSEERWRNLFETSSVGIAITEPDGRILRANQALQTMLGYNESDLRLLRLSDLMAGGAGAGEERTREGGLELPLRRADGHILWVSLSVSAIPASDASPPLTSAVVIDISARRRAIEDWRKGQSEVARATRLTTMGVLAASIAHEVNQPLSGVVTNGQAADRWLSADTPDIKEARAALARIVRDGNRAAEIIKSIRNVLDPVGEEPRPLAINHVIERLVPLVENELAAHSIRLVLDLAKALPEVTGDAVQLQQLLLNLILNGIDAMRGTLDTERVMAVRTLKAGRDVVVSVEDHGSGLPDISHDRLFEPFFTTKPEGMGVGLAICRTVVESHGGRIWAEPLAPRGAKFAFALPAAEGGGTLAKKKEAKHDSNRNHSGRR